MRAKNFGLSLAWWAVVLGAAAQLTAQNNPTPNLESNPDAETLFRNGDFEQAAQAFRQVIASGKKTSDALLRMAQIALLKNDLAEADRWLKQGQESLGESKELSAMFAELCYRKNDFAAAAPYFRSMGNAVMADKLASFKGVQPYALDPDGPTSTRLPFVRTDPLPVVSLKANEGGDVFAIIDTGGAELILDPEYATQVGAQRFGASGIDVRWWPKGDHRARSNRFAAFGRPDHPQRADSHPADASFCRGGRWQAN